MIINPSKILSTCGVAVALVLAAQSFAGGKDHKHRDHHSWGKHHSSNVQVGPRPYFLIDDMDESWLKRKLQRCENKPLRASDFSIGHRGAALQFPEHTKESYEAAARMGAGIVECDVTFTQDKELVCRHSQCDLHTTTNILETPLASKCSTPFTPAEYDEAGNMVRPASARCCTSDITVAEFKTLKGKMDAANPRATNVQEYLDATANYRTDLYASRGTLLTHKESIELFKKLNVKMTPELKSASVAMPFDGFSQQDYAQKMVDEYKQAGVPARKVWAQSFNIEDVRYWVANEPRFGRQAVYLDGRYDDSSFDHRDPATWQPSMAELAAEGVQIIAPPTWMLLEVENGKIVPSLYADSAKQAGLDIITWTMERSGLLVDGGGWYFQTVNGLNPNPVNPEPGVINNEGDMVDVLDVLAQDVGVIGVFSDWPAMTTYYANCMDL
ncbi:glycerophosphodiester phosphodiesterase family protein [Saccharophagus degradans]|uniref:glycerophosphodiester phosphodiesterase n=1 Tax=Saccharophagus degradans (strain 2-40 / ATCC 43961 / DSM 17024) TaxID=203122 RepID=Q21ML6_SACD2|nr:glycerophosphodiester phosphodiesterase family protein [Saccharophagus degradans]ABD80063.1 glycerophosphoryl diester phosphodiesterase [Saccharophagus degradans 2-40]